ncbi:DUF2931 family protein [Chryseobacterium indoltheticum]|uniref:DUF2931 family protein n=1 Tax=Chryseobacterium indoltheticum TaxID=254 RepID=UPI003F49A9C1
MGDSGKGWTEQHGTPIGADIIYFSDYENKVYHLDVDFPIEKIKDYMERAYPEEEDFGAETKPYKRLGRNYEYTAGKQPYSSFATLVFGFAPKGMVVVWLRYTYFSQIELGRYQAEEVNDQQTIIKARKKYIDDFRTTEENFNQVIKESYIPDASPALWDNYRTKL